MASRQADEGNENTCIVCYKSVEIYSIGQCDHPVCFECSTRMRVLCKQNECPICRQDMPTVVFTTKIQPYSHLKLNNRSDNKFKIVFDSEKVEQIYYNLLDHNCLTCNKKFKSFAELKDHMRRSHLLNYCELCVNNLKIFTSERRCYTRQELGVHRRQGDPDDRSHRGHPLCQFCDTRFMDNDELYRHLRRTHLYCHFCDADGCDHYYSNYECLREHFRSEHYLCEEGNCYDERFTSVFRTEIDFKAHRASVHGRAIGKAGIKQARTLELEFTLAPRPRITRNVRPRDEETEVGAVGGNDEPVFTQINTECMEEFPSLGGKGGPTSVPNTSSHQGKVTATIRSGSRGFTISDENFPALGPEATVSLHVNSERPIISSVVNSKPPNLSIQVNHRPSGFTTRVSSSGGNSNMFKEDFPALSGKLTGPLMNIASTQWSTNKKPESKVTIVKHKQPEPPPPKQNKSHNFHMENDFPSLSSQFNSACALPKETKPGKNLSSGDWAPASNSFVNAQSSDSDAIPVVTPRNKKKKPKSKKTDTSGNASTSANDSKKTTSKEKHNEAKLTEQPEKVKKKGKESNDASNKVPSSSVCSNNNNVIHHENNNEYLDKSKNDLPGGKPERKKEEKRKQVKQAPDKATLSNLEEFPIMGRLKPRPPGFSDIARVPPPGFELPRREVAKPPPGLQPPSLPPGLEIAKPPPGFSITNGVLYPPLGNHYTYVSPVDFPRRNSLLIGKIVKTIGQNRLDDFKEISVCFRSGEMSAKDYYEYCQDTMGHSAFYEIFPELLALLPDITKQQELWPLYKRNSETDSLIKNKKNKLEACATCGQVIKFHDLREHLSNHALENHFPALNGVTPVLNQAWQTK